MSLRVLDLQRAITYRHGRNAILKHFGLTGLPRPVQHDIMVLTKKNGYGPAAWNTLCPDARTAVESIDPRIPVRCFDPVTQTIKEQIIEAQKSTIVIAEHGTISYAAIYARNGAVLISIGSSTLLKEPQTLLFATHFQTLYMVSEIRGDLRGMIKTALNRAGENFDIK